MASAEVTTSSGMATTPTEPRRSTTCAGVRLELFVTNASRLPASRNAVTAAAAPGMASGHRYRTPSRSSRIASYGSASTAQAESRSSTRT